MTVRDRLLARPSAYQGFKSVIGASRHMEVFLREYARPAPGERLLDIGCGTGDAALSLPDVTYVGIDLSDDYIDAAKRRNVPGAEFVSASVEELGDLGLGSFDCAIAVGVLHHLPDDVVTGMLEALSPLLVGGGRFVTIDPVWAPDSSTVGRVLASLDRGRYVRDQAGYERLLRAHFPKVEGEVRHDLLKIPYSHCVVRSELG
jgi:SAM-dependent methyltransferase